jgi:hypothetical protein
VDLLDISPWARSASPFVNRTLIEMLAYEAKGFLPMATHLAIKRWYTSSTTHAFAVLDEYSDQGGC